MTSHGSPQPNCKFGRGFQWGSGIPCCHPPTLNWPSVLVALNLPTIPVVGEGVSRQVSLPRSHGPRAKSTCHDIFKLSSPVLLKGSRFLQRLQTQERKISPKRKFLGRTSCGHPGVIRANIPTQNFGQGVQNPGKASILARTSMTRGRGRPRPIWAFQ